MYQVKGARKVAIVGGGMSKCLLPVADTSIEKWVLAISCPEALPYASRAFELHKGIFDPESSSWTDLKEPNRSQALGHYKTILKEVKCPVYMVEKSNLVPTSVEYPFKDVIWKMGSYFDNSISYMIAMAIMEGVDVLMFYGIDFLEERAHFVNAKSACEYYIGLAIGRKIDVLIAPGSSLLKASTGKIYGIDMYMHELFPDHPELKEGFDGEQKIIEDMKAMIKQVGEKIEAMNPAYSLSPKETQINRVVA